jgi:hypothetical protein
MAKKLRDPLSVGIIKFPASSFDPVTAMQGFGTKLAALQKAKEDGREAERLRISKMLKEEVTTDFAIDNLGIIQPQKEALEKQYLDELVTNGGIATAQMDFRYQNAFNKLKQAATVSDFQAKWIEKNIDFAEQHSNEIEDDSWAKIAAQKDPISWYAIKENETLYPDIYKEVGESIDYVNETFPDASDGEKKQAVRNVADLSLKLKPKEKEDKYNWLDEVISDAGKIGADSTALSTPVFGSSATTKSDLKVKTSFDTRYATDSKFKTVTDINYANDLNTGATTAKNVSDYLLEKAKPYVGSSASISIKDNDDGGSGNGAKKQLGDYISGTPLYTLKNGKKVKVDTQEYNISDFEKEITASANFAYDPTSGNTYELSGNPTFKPQAIQKITDPLGNSYYAIAVNQLSLGGSKKYDNLLLPYTNAVREKLLESYEDTGLPKETITKKELEKILSGETVTKPVTTKKTITWGTK